MRPTSVLAAGREVLLEERTGLRAQGDARRIRGRVPDVLQLINPADGGGEQGETADKHDHTHGFLP